MSHTQPKTFPIAHSPAIGLNFVKHVAPTTFGAITVKEHSQSSGKDIFQHIVDNDLASFSRHSGCDAFKTSAVI